VISAEPVLWGAVCGEGALAEGTLEIWRTSAAAGRVLSLTPEEQARAERMLNPMRRAQFSAGHTLLNRIHARHGSPLCTSLSHSGPWIVAAVGRGGPVGVDVERLQPNRPLDHLSQRFFPPEEHAWLAEFPEAERANLFYALWTAKEALFKALGMPVGAAHLAARRILSPEDKKGLPECSIVEGCRVGWFSVADGYLGAYAVSGVPSNIHYISVD